jgi:hypothetical protein
MQLIPAKLLILGATNLCKQGATGSILDPLTNQSYAVAIAYPTLWQCNITLSSSYTVPPASRFNSAGHRSKTQQNRHSVANVTLTTFKVPVTQRMDSRSFAGFTLSA